MKYVVPVPGLAFLPINETTDRYPVHRIYCVGRNYAAHAVEMGHDPAREEPFFFQKNPDNLVINNGDFPYPGKSADVHHEVELVVALGEIPKTGPVIGQDIPVELARQCIWGYATALDMTRRDLQATCKKAGRPWEIGKSFDASAPCSTLQPASVIGHPEAGLIELKVNGEIRQTGNLNQMIWKIPEIISYLSGLFTLAPGDLIMTGTPAGVGAIEKGDKLEAQIENIASMECTVI